MPHLHLEHTEKCDCDYCCTNYDVVFIGGDFYLLSTTSCNLRAYEGKHEFIQRLLKNALDKVGVKGEDVYRIDYESIERIRKMEYHIESMVHDVCYIYKNAAYKEFCVCYKRMWIEKFMANQDINKKYNLFEEMIRDLFSEKKEGGIKTYDAKNILRDAKDLLGRNVIYRYDIEHIHTTDHLIKKLKEYARTGQTDPLI